MQILQLGLCHGLNKKHVGTRPNVSQASPFLAPVAAGILPVILVQGNQLSGISKAPASNGKAARADMVFINPGQRQLKHEPRADVTPQRPHKRDTVAMISTLG